MKINLISKEEYLFIKSIYNKHQNLFLQNKGYETIQNLTEDDKLAIKDIEKILKKSIAGFSNFQNFRFNKNLDIQLRILYNYSYDNNGVHFIGVGYILLDELLKGFGIVNATHDDYLNEAIKLGAVSMRIYSIEKYEIGFGKKKIPFSYHFFNTEDLEICYYISDLMNLVDMFVFKEPRVWSDEFKNNPDYVFVKL